MRRQRWAWTHRYAVPMFVASLVAVILAGSGLIAVMVLDDDGTAPQSGMDRCVLGGWRMISHTEDISSLGLTTQLRLNGEGARYEFREDGTGSGYYGDGTTFESTTFGQRVPAIIAGRVNFRYEAADGTFQITAMLSSDATFTVEAMDVEVPYRLSTTSPESYSCEGDTLTLSLEERNYTAEYQRL